MSFYEQARRATMDAQEQQQQYITTNGSRQRQPPRQSYGLHPDAPPSYTSNSGSQHGQIPTALQSGGPARQSLIGSSRSAVPTRATSNGSSALAPGDSVSQAGAYLPNPHTQEGIPLPGQQAYYNDYNDPYRSSYNNDYTPAQQPYYAYHQDGYSSPYDYADGTPGQQQKGSMMQRVNSDDDSVKGVDDTLVGNSTTQPGRRSRKSTASGYRHPSEAYGADDVNEDHDFFRGNDEYPPTAHYADDKEKGIQSSDDLVDASQAAHGDTRILDLLRARNTKRAEAQDTAKKPNVLIRQIWDNSPVEQKVANHKRGIGVQSRPWACYIFAVACTVTFSIELIQSAQRTGKAISTSPFNYMIGPSSELLINVGARFTGCMRSVPEISSMPFACLNETSSSTITTTCSLSDVCGFGGFGTNNEPPHQTFRFFTAMWLHVGVIHLLLNSLVLLTSSGLVEKQMGTLKFVILYMFTGVFGFILGGNFALVGLASMGASGAIFGTHAAVLVDLIAHWSLFDKPIRMLLGLLFEIIVGFGLGYIPGIDNFSHIGGFALGLLLSIVLLPSIHQTQRHRWIMYGLRVFALIGACVMFGVLYNNFFTSDPNSACEWCRYLSCWPTSANNHCKGTGLTTTTTATTSNSGSGSEPNSGSSTVGSQVNGGLALIYVLVFFSRWIRNTFFSGRTTQHESDDKDKMQ